LQEFTNRRFQSSETNNNNKPINIKGKLKDMKRSKNQLFVIQNQFVNSKNMMKNTRSQKYLEEETF